MKLGEDVLEVKKLRVERGGFRILSDIDWRVRAGEHWVILGANGSGKTSLLSALTGYLTPSGGEVRVLGRQYGAHDWRELRKSIGIVSPAIGQLIDDEQTAAETVGSGRDAVINQWRPLPTWVRRDAAGMLDRVECGPLSSRPWIHLSQGERQRVLIGRALMANSRLLILDEPCAGLDPAAREQFLAFLSRLAVEPSQPGLILVTHHVEEILPFLRHVLLLRGGRVLAAGRRQDVLNSAALSETFGVPVRLRRRSSRYELTVPSRPGVAI